MCIRDSINVPDADPIYRIPLLLHAQGVDDIVARKLRLDHLPAAQLADWERVVRAIETAIDTVDIAMVGKYVDLADAYKSCLLYTSPSPRDRTRYSMPSSA